MVDTDTTETDDRQRQRYGTQVRLQAYVCLILVHDLKYTRQSVL